MWDQSKFDSIESQEGKHVIITGPNSGIGYDTALFFVKKNASVILAGRNIERCENAMARMLQVFPTGNITIMQLDLSSLSSVKKFCEEYKVKFDKLDILINNAGCLQKDYEKTVDNLECTIATNYFGPFALTLQLLDSLRNAKGTPRIVNVGSLGEWKSNLDLQDINWEKRKYRSFQAYCDSKLAIMMFAPELQRRLNSLDEEKSFVVTLAHPGFTRSNLGQRQNVFSKLLFKVGPGQSSAMGALPTIRAALDTDGVQGGEYFGPRAVLELFGYPKKTNPKNTMYFSDESKETLWNLSLELTGAEFK